MNKYIDIPNDVDFHCSAYKRNHIISENTDEYWCWGNNNIFDIKLKVKKDCTDGYEITKVLSDEPINDDIELLQMVIDNIILKNMSSSEIIKAYRINMKNCEKSSFERGVRSVKTEFKKFLEL